MGVKYIEDTDYPKIEHALPSSVCGTSACHLYYREVFASLHTCGSETLTWSFPHPSTWKKSLKSCASWVCSPSNGPSVLQLSSVRWHPQTRCKYSLARHPVFFFPQFCWLRTREGEFILIPHSVVMRAVLTCPGMLCTLQGHPPAATGIDPLSNSDLGVEPALFGSLISGGEFLLHSIFFLLLCSLKPVFCTILVPLSPSEMGFQGVG